jgi:hypothetical protein
MENLELLVALIFFMVVTVIGLWPLWLASFFTTSARSANQIGALTGKTWVFVTLVLSGMGERKVLNQLLRIEIVGIQNGR